MLPDRHGRYGRDGGRFVPETLMPALLELEKAYRRISRAGIQRGVGLVSEGLTWARPRPFILPGI